MIPPSEPRGRRRLAAALIVAAVAAASLFMAAGSASALEDVTAPQLVSESFSPTRIDTSSSDQTVVVNLQATDDLSGVDYIYVTFVSPTGTQARTAYPSLVSGSTTNGFYRGSVTFPQFSASGSWRLYYVVLVDRLGNSRYLYTSDLQSRGLPTTLTNSPPTTPGSPFIGSASPGNGQAFLSWSAPSSDGGSAITGYVVTPYIGSSPQPSQTFNSTSTSQTITNLSNGTSYSFRVAAINGVGTGSQSSSSNTVTPYGVPGTPSGVSASGGDGQATVSWFTPSSNGSSINGYVVTPYIGSVAQSDRTFNSTSTSQTITGLTNGTQYSFRVAARNAAGIGAQSAASNVVTPAGLPGAPSIGTAVAGDTQVTLNWSAPNNNGGSTVSGYVVTPYIGSTAQPSKTFDSSATSQLITGLNNGTSYTFRVAAKNAIGTGPQSGASNAVTPNSTPTAPTITSATPGDGQVTLSWTTPTGGPGPITDYWYEIFVNGVQQDINNFGSTATTQTIGGLTNGTTYTFVIAARYSSTFGPESAQSNAVTPAGLPGTPSVGSPVAGDGQVSLSWTTPSSNGSAITGYVVTPYINGVAQAAHTFIDTSTSQTLTGLTNGTAYTFRVAAINGVGTGNQSNASNAVTPAGLPSAPTIGTASGDDGQATVRWAAPSTNGGSSITGYVVTPYIGSAAQPPQSFNSTATSQAVTGLTNGVSYSFRVAAITAAGTGPQSNASNVVIPAGLPGAPSIYAATPGDGQVTLSWDAPADDGGSPITGYVVTPYIGFNAQPSETFDAGTTQTVYDLTNGTKYGFTVGAINDVGTGPQSSRFGGVAPSAPPTVKTNPKAAWSGTVTLVVWEDYRNGESDIYGARVNASGTVLDPSGIPISRAKRAQLQPMVAWNGSNFLVAWSDGRSGADYDIYGTTVTPAGGVVKPGGVAISTAVGDQSYPSARANGATWLVAWQDDRNATTDIYSTRVTSAGSPTNTSGVAISKAAHDQRRPSVASNGSGWLVVWGDRRPSNSNSDIYSTRVTTAGAVTNANGVAVSTAAHDQAAPSVAWNGSTYMVVWSDYRSNTSLDVYGSRISSAGATLNASGIAISKRTGVTEAGGTLTAIGSNFLVVWQDDRNGTFDIYGSRLSSSGGVLNANGIKVNGAAGDQAYPAIALNGNNYFPVWADSRTASTSIYGAKLSSTATITKAGFPIAL
jgi:titin